MAIQRTHRVPVLLLALLAATLLFPGALDEARLAVGSLLPATVPEGPEPGPLAAEDRAKLLGRIASLEEELGARAGGDGPLRDVRVLPRRDAAGPRAVAARVLHREPSATRRTFVIDAGREDALVPGLPVVQRDSLVGVVSSVVGGAARVVRVDDRSPATAFAATVLAADAGPDAPLRAQGVARGTGDGRLRVSFLPQGAARPGDLVVTAAGSRGVPPGLVLGAVVSCDDDDRDGEYEAVVAPLRDLDAVSSVLVLLVEAPGLGAAAK